MYNNIYYNYIVPGYFSHKWTEGGTITTDNYQLLQLLDFKILFLNYVYNIFFGQIIYMTFTCRFQIDSSFIGENM